NTDRRRMPGKGKKKKGKKGSKHPPTALEGKPPVFFGTLLTPRIGESGPIAEAGESCGTTSGDWDWYNDFQSSELDSYYPAERPSLILASLHGSTKREEPAGQFWGGPVYGLGSSWSMRTGTWRWSLLGPTTPTWMIIGATLIMERKGSIAVSVCGQTWGPIVNRTLLWRWKRTLKRIFPPTATLKALRTMSPQHPRLCLRLRLGHAAPEQASCPGWLAGRERKHFPNLNRDKSLLLGWVGSFTILLALVWHRL
ncbi:hypothetical protein P4O66_008833, partial [Electrophorus voltai]